MPAEPRDSDAERLWRVGRKIGRTIYAVDTATRDDRMIGVMDTPHLAAEAVKAHNDALRAATPTAAGLAAQKFLSGGCSEPGCDGRQVDTSPGGTWLYSCGHHVGK